MSYQSEIREVAEGIAEVLKVSREPLIEKLNELIFLARENGHMLHSIREQENQNMADLTALKAVVAKIKDDAAAIRAALEAALAGQTTQAEVDAITADVTAADGVLTTSGTPAP